MKKLQRYEEFNIQESFKGKLSLEATGWTVITDAGQQIALSPEDCQEIESAKRRFDNIEARILAEPDVEFDIVHQGEMLYAKLK